MKGKSVLRLVRGRYSTLRRNGSAKSVSDYLLVDLSSGEEPAVRW